jgi:serralysin
VALTGTLAQINTTLSAANNVVYRGAQDFFGTDTLTVVTDDGGNTGTGGALGDTDAVTIELHTHLFGTPGNDAFDVLPGNLRIDALGGIDTVTFGFRLVDATVSYLGNTIVIDGPGGSSHTVLTGFEVFEFTDGTVNNNDGIRLVDDLFYYSKYHDVWNAHVDADAHFVSFGRDEGRDPNAFFSTLVYRSANPDVAAAGVNPLDHFDAVGWLEGRVPSIHFDPAQYLAANPDVAAAHVDPLRHYLEFGYQEGRQPFNPTELIGANGFDFVYYLNNNPDVAAAGVNPYQHFQTFGWQEGRNPNALFDTNGYLSTYGDVAAAHVNPLDHYNTFGWHEGRDPSVGFDTTAYLAAYPDVAAAHVNPLAHFLQFGIHEGRSPFADGVWG